MATAKKVRQSRTPKQAKSTPMDRYHELVDKELLNQLTNEERAELLRLQGTLKPGGESAHWALLQQLREDRAALRRSLESLSAVVRRAGSA